MSYNLVVEAWIPVLYRNGEWRRVGIPLPRARGGEPASSNSVQRTALPAAADAER